MKFSACARTDVGLRRSNNEDSVHADPQNGLFIVADGMGGHAAGEVASAMAVETLCGELPPAGPPPTDAAIGLKEAFFLASRRIRAAAGADPTRRGMGTTLSVLYRDGDSFQLAHVGDSRIYRLRQSRLEQLSIDHSLVAEQVRRGIISADEARSSGLRNVLLQAVGLEDEVDVFLLRSLLQTGDLFLLCSDGLCDMIEDQRIEEILNHPLSVEELAGELIQAALDAGGDDNIGVVVVRVEDESAGC